MQLDQCCQAPVWLKLLDKTKRFRRNALKVVTARKGHKALLQPEQNSLGPGDEKGAMPLGPVFTILNFF